MAHPYRSRSYILPARNVQTHNTSYRSMSSHEQWSSTPTSRTLKSFYAHEDFYDDYLRSRSSQKKSIFAKAKEKAKKWRQTLLRTKSNKQEEDHNGTPPWGVSLNDEDEEDDPELIHGTSKTGLDAFEESDSEKNSTIHYPSPCNGASNSAPPPALNNKEKESEMKHSNDKQPSRELLGPPSTKLAPVAVSTTKLAPVAVSTTKLAPVAVSTTTLAPVAVSKTKIAPVAVSATKAAPAPDATTTASPSASPASAKGSKTLGETVAETLAPAYAAVAEATLAISSRIQVSAGKQLVWEKGSSIREYLMQKLAEPKAEDRALCNVISEAVSPRSGGGHGFFEEEEKKKEGVASSPPLASSSSPPPPPPPLASSSSSSSVLALALVKEEEAEPSTKREKADSPIPVSTNPQPGGCNEASGRTLRAYTN